MAVNPLQSTVPYSISASNETADHSRQREEKNPNKNNPTKPTKTVPNPLELAQKNIERPPIEKEALELTSQIIDSQKVIELLSHRPKYKKLPKNCFKIQKSESPDSQLSDVKTLNKSY
jgi:hypothetical protein